MSDNNTVTDSQLPSYYDNNLSFVNDRFDTQSSITADIVGGVVATVADYGATTWNSLPAHLPGVDTVDTMDLLNRLGQNNAARVYQEHPDTIQAASFLGGMLIPSTLALKGMTSLRNGMKGANWFTEAGKVESLANYKKLIEGGVEATKDFNKTRELYYGIGKGLANSVVDFAAMEGAITMTMNAHPFMDDYNKNFVSHFAEDVLLSPMAIGFHGIAGIMAASEFKAIERTTAMAAKTFLLKDIKAAEVTDNMAEQVTQRAANIKTWTDIIKESTPDAQGIIAKPIDQYTREMADSFIKYERAKLWTSFDTMTSSEIQAMSRIDGYQEGLLKMITENPERFPNVIDKIDFLKLQVESRKGKGLFASLASQKEGKLVNSMEDISVQNFPMTRTTANGEVVADAVVYYPEFGAFSTAKEVKGFSSAADLGLTEENLVKGIDANQVARAPRGDWNLIADTMSTAMVDAEYLKYIKVFDNMSDKEFMGVVRAAAPDDLPMLQAMHIRASKMENSSEFKVAITKNEPNWDAIQTQAAARQGVSKDYISNLKAMEANFDTKYNLGRLTAEVSPMARSTLRGWIMGERDVIKELRGAVDAHFRGGYATTDSVYKQVIRQWYDAPTSKAFRNDISTLADSNGYVYLYRGLHSDRAFGHNSIDSYTTNPIKAREHARGGSVELYKVRPDEILTAFRDTAGDSRNNNYEVLVMSPTRETGVVMAGKNTVSNAEIIAKNTTKSSVFQNIQELGDTLKQAKIDSLKSMLGQGFPEQTIALRLNIPVENVRNFATNTIAHGEETQLAQVTHADINRYTDAASIGTYLAPERRALVMNTNINKIPHNALKAEISVGEGNTIGNEIFKEISRMSLSEIHQMTFRALEEESTKAGWNLVRANLGSLVSEAIGMKLLQSTDFALRKLPNGLGNVISTMGKNLSTITEKLSAQILTPVSRSFESFVKDVAARTEFNTAMAVEASISGYKEFNSTTGKWMQQSKEMPWREIKNGKGQVVEKIRNLIPVEFQGQPYAVVTPSVIDAIVNMQKLGREFYELGVTRRQVAGFPAMTDIGFWRPSVNPRDKHIAYVLDNITQETTMLYGKTDKELQQAIALYKSAHTEDIEKESKIVLTKREQKLYNEVQGRHDPMFMTNADVNMLRTGSAAPATVSTNAEIFSELMGGYDHYMGYGVRKIFMDAHSDVFQDLERYSEYAQRFTKDQPLGMVEKATQTTHDAGSIIKNTLLGANDIREYQGWKALQDNMQGIAEHGLRVIRDISGPFIPSASTIKGFFGKEVLSEETKWKRLVTDMTDRGIVLPWQNVADSIAMKQFGVDNLAGIPNMTPRLIAVGHKLASTALLRFMDVAQGMVNTMSLPILMSGAITRKYDNMFMGAKLAPDFETSFLGHKIMAQGIEVMNSPMRAADHAWAESNKLYVQQVSEVNKTLSDIYSMSPDRLAKLNKMLDSKTIDRLSIVADSSEGLVRKWSFSTGLAMADKAYPGLSDAGKRIFARSFMEETVGNYSAAQRPVIFQGNMGVAMGLFQTYMVTYAQSLFRHIEMGDKKALMSQMLMQGGIFGTSSLPGFHQVSEYIGEHYSDKNYDLNTGTYRAVNNTLADIILYGLPSNIAPTFTTRGDIAPRIPNVVGGLQNVPLANLVKSAYTYSENLLQAALHTDGNTFRALAEATSLQNLNRPIARLAELATGNSITSKGNVISGPDEVYSVRGVIARILATRPLREQKLREAEHLNTLYGSLDRDQRQELVSRLKTHLRNGDLNEEVLTKLAEGYLRTGTPTGWRASVNQAIGQAASPDSTVANHLDPSSPLMMMIDDMD